MKPPVGGFPPGEAEGAVNRRGTIRAIALGAALGVAALAGCSSATRERVLSFFFDGVVQPERPPTQRVRRDLLREIEDLKRQLAEAKAGAAAAQEDAAAEEDLLPAEQAETWEEAVEVLPKDDTGNVNWVQALADGVIAPRPGAAPDAEDQPLFPLDLELVPESGDMFKALFSHEVHTAWLACPSCHPAIFPMQRGATPITMEKINAGETCGVCHGTVAFPATACGRCHPAMAG